MWQAADEQPFVRNHYILKSINNKIAMQVHMHFINIQ